MEQPLYEKYGQTISIEINGLAAQSHLGTVLTEYKGRTTLKLILGVLVSLLGAAFIVLSLIVFCTTRFDFKMLVGLFMGIALAGYGIGLAKRASRNDGAQLYRCTDGVMLVKGDRVEAIRWEQIITFQKVYGEWTTRGQTAYLLQQYILTRSDGTQLVLDNTFSHFKDLGIVIEHEVTQRQFPTAFAAYSAGMLVNFDGIGVSFQGISVENGERILGWHELKRVVVKNGVLFVKKTGALLDWEIIKTSEMPNLCVFIALVQHLTQGQGIQVR